jgi:hypothetical protein
VEAREHGGGALQIESAGGCLCPAVNQSCTLLLLFLSSSTHLPILNAPPPPLSLCSSWILIKCARRTNVPALSFTLTK